VNQFILRGSGLNRPEVTITGRLYDDTVVFSDVNPSWITAGNNADYTRPALDTSTKRIEVCFDDANVSIVLNTFRNDSSLFGASRSLFIRALFNSSVNPSATTSQLAATVAGRVEGLNLGEVSILDPLV
jgi:hypothetical protein